MAAFPDPTNADFSALSFVNAYRKGAWERGKLVHPADPAFVATVAGADVQAASFWATVQNAISSVATFYVRAGFRGWIGKPWWYLSGDDGTGPHSGTDPHYASFGELLQECGYPAGGWIRERPRRIASTASVVDEMGNAVANGQLAWLIGDATGRLRKRVGGAWTVAAANEKVDRISSANGEVPFGPMQAVDYISVTMFRQMKACMERMFITTASQSANANLRRLGTDTEFQQQDAIDGAEAAYAAASFTTITEPTAYATGTRSPSGSAPPDDFIYTADIKRERRQHRVDGVPNHMSITKRVVFTASTIDVENSDTFSGARWLFDNQDSGSVRHAVFFQIGSEAMTSLASSVVASEIYGAGNVPQNYIDPFPNLADDPASPPFPPITRGWQNWDDAFAMVTWNFEYGGNNTLPLAGLGLALGML